VDADDPTPPYEQLRRQLDQAVRSGTVPAGHRLPPIRQLARDLGLAAGTVARTYRELEQAGLVTAARGGGTRVRDDLVATPPSRRRAELDSLADRFVSDARLLGADDASVLAALHRRLG
jgi:DNA-binding transcriptional regulator YhcF (GntR family)